MNDIITDLTNTTKKPQGEVSAAWDLAKQQALSKYRDSDEEYYPYVVSLTKQYLNQQQQDKNIQGQKTSIFSQPPQNSTYKPNPNSESMFTESNEDYLDWKISSTEKLARVRFLIVDKLYEMTFKHIKEGQVGWNYEWQPLVKQGINSVVVATIEQLNGDINNQKVSVNKNNIQTENKEQIYKAMMKCFEQYFKDYNKVKDIQYFLFTTETEFRYKFIREFINRFFIKKYLKFQLIDEVGKSISKPLIRVVAIKNSDAKLKEKIISEEGEGGDGSGTVMSSAFSDAPADAGRKRKDWKKDWELQNPNKAKKEKRKKIRIVNISLID